MSDSTLTPVAEALGRIPSGLFIVASRDDRGYETAFLASWVMQAGFSPPAISVAVGMDRAARTFVQKPGSTFTVSIIAADEKGSISPFAKGIEPAEDALKGLPVERTASGIAVVEGCLAWLECRTLDAARSLDHSVVIAEVIGARGGREDAPAVHLRKDGLGY